MLNRKRRYFCRWNIRHSDNSNTIFSAHGVSDKVETDAKIKSLSIVDASTLVKKVHVEALKYYEQGYKKIFGWAQGHPEVEGTAGRVPGGVKLLRQLIMWIS